MAENKQIFKKLEVLESSCNNFHKVAEDYQKKAEELSAENEVCEFIRPYVTHVKFVSLGIKRHNQINDRSCKFISDCWTVWWKPGKDLRVYHWNCWQINDLKESIQLSANGVMFANFFYKSVWRLLFFKIIFHKNWNAAAKNFSFISKFYRLSRGQKTRFKRRLSREPYATAYKFV